MSRISTHAISFCLIGSGVLAWAFAGRPLVTNPDLDVPLNPLGINGSPYGEVFAMAMQGSIETYFHGGMGVGAHRHEDGQSCDSCKKTAEIKPAAKSNPSLERRFENFLASLGKVSEVSTNPKAPSDAHKRYLRRQTEDKLRFAYQLDPSHYGNYNSLNFFLTEPAVGTRPELTPSAAKLAQDTIQYCLKQEHDPRPALTAAAAATNMLHLMFEDLKSEQPKFTPAQMRQCLDITDHCLVRYETLAKEWDQTKNWQLLSPQRVNECDERFHFIVKIRDAAEKTILRLEGKLQPQVSGESKGLKVSKS
jgi:hypothetical protein